MKILYHHRTASKDGQAVHIEEMIHALRKRGHEVRVVAPGQGSTNGANAENGENASSDGPLGAKVAWVHRLKALLPKALYELLELGYSLIAYRRLAAVAREFQPDVLYERYNLFLLSGLMLKRRTGIPMLLEVNSPLVDERRDHGGLALERLGRWAEGTAWRGADCVLPVTEVLAGHVRDYGVPTERICVIPNGINVEQFAQAPTPDEAKCRLGLEGRCVLGFTGFVRDWHGVDRVIRWMASPAAPANSYLLIVGDGPVRKELEQLAEQLGLRDRFRVTGVIPRERVPEHVAAFDIALQPAVTPYASPLKLIEYLALGKAIVAPREPNLLEVLSDGCNALMFDKTSPTGLETALTELSASVALRERLADEAAKTIARLNLTWDGNAQRVEELARGMMDRVGAKTGARPR